MRQETKPHKLETNMVLVHTVVPRLFGVVLDSKGMLLFLKSRSGQTRGSAAVKE